MNQNKNGFSWCRDFFFPMIKYLETFVKVGLLKPHGLNTPVTNAVNIFLLFKFVSGKQFLILHGNGGAEGCRGQ